MNIADRRVRLRFDIAGLVARIRLCRTGPMRENLAHELAELGLAKPISAQGGISIFGVAAAPTVTDAGLALLMWSEAAQAKMDELAGSVAENPIDEVSGAPV